MLGHEATSRFDVHVAGVGVASAQGSGSDIAAGRPPLPACRSPWASAGRAASWCRPVPGVEPGLAGPGRWNLLARRALGESALDAASPAPPLVVASCNGGGAELDADGWRRAFDAGALLAGTPWAEAPLPVVSGSCASGLHALFLATRLLAVGRREVVVLAADALSPSSQVNFEALRVLSDDPEPPWQPRSTGFVPGEAAVALRLTRAPAEPRLARLFGPALAQDLDGGGLARALAPLAARTPDLVLGLGTGPYLTDAAELDSVGRTFPGGVPLATSLAHFGHTLGASGPLSLSLALIAARAARPLPALQMPAPRAADGRPLWSGTPRPQVAVVAARALSGACAAAALSVDGPVSGYAGPGVNPGPAAMGAYRRFAASPPNPQDAAAPRAAWLEPAVAGPLMHPLLRRIAADAPLHRPARPPAVLIVRLDAPLLPPPRARVGGRLLPAAVVEITPGFIPRLVAGAWGFAGGALCLVGGAEAEVGTLLEACRAAAGPVSLLRVSGSGEDRDVEWQPGD